MVNGKCLKVIGKYLQVQQYSLSGTEFRKFRHTFSKLPKQWRRKMPYTKQMADRAPKFVDMDTM